MTPKVEGRDKIDIRIPLMMVRLGMKMASLVPDNVLEKIQVRLKEKGVDFDLSDVNPENADKFLAAMVDLDINIDNEKETLHVYCGE